MTIKHTPATPLPWTSVGHDGGIFGQKSRLRVSEPVKFLDDREYIAHAANAYPKLIANLLSLYAVMESTGYDATTEAMRAHDLLRELGELP